MNTLLWMLLIVLAWVGTRWFYLQKLATAFTALNALNTEKTRLEAKVRQVNEREDHLIGAVNHFFNNTISIQTGFTELLQEELKALAGVQPGSFQKLELIAKAGRRLAVYIQSFSRPVTRQEMVDEYLKMIKKE